MFPKLEYLAWAIERYAHVRFDLGSSGLALLPAEELGEPKAMMAAAHDPNATKRWRAAIARRFEVGEGEVVPVVGTTHGLFSIYAATLSHGDDVLVESPAYEPFVRLAEALGARVVHFDRPLSRGAVIDPEIVARAITPKTKLVVVSNLHNPTGAYTTDEVISAVAAIARKNGAILLVDEVYRDLVDYAPTRAATAYRLGPGIVSTSSLTKVYGLGWVRGGWVLAEPSLAARIFNATLHTVGDVSFALASVGTIALERIEAIHARSKALRADDAARADRVEAFLKARPHLSWTRPRGSVFGFVTDARGHDLRPVIDRAVTEEQVIVAPGSFFRAPNGFRLRFGAIPDATLDEGLARLGRALDHAGESK